MKCRLCGVEMIVDSVEELEDSEVFHYKCANPNCPNYGYKKAEKAETNDVSPEEG